MKFLSIICSSLLIMPSIINAHGGRMDIRGYHNNSKSAIYHCHDGSSSNACGLAKTIITQHQLRLLMI